MGRKVFRGLLAAVAMCIFVLSSYAQQTPPAQKPSSASIVGRWRTMETTKGGIGSIYEFHSNGVVDFSVAAVVEMPWRIENSQLVLPSDTDGGAERKSTLKWLGDKRLNLADGSPGGVELTRVGVRTDERNPILGEWLSNQEMAGHTLEAHWLFYQGGKLLFLLPIKTLHGSYKVSGSTLHLETPDNKKTDSKFVLADDRMTVYESDGSSETHLARY